mmetsp:Transcript_67591/g.162272  ORF Transcript_67591/g.162272 Transcript_67591/m.162272 type:complete len:257 (-) Transcript_67591:553-1323(-)
MGGILADVASLCENVALVAIVPRHIARIEVRPVVIDVVYAVVAAVYSEAFAAFSGFRIDIPELEDLLSSALPTLISDKSANMSGQTQVAPFLSDLEGRLGDDAPFNVYSAESVHKVAERPALQSLLQPIVVTNFLLVNNSATVDIQELVIPCSCHSPSVVGSRSLHPVPSSSPRITSTPHVGYPASSRSHDLTTAEPGSQRLIKVLAAPTMHSLVKTSCQVEPLTAHCYQATTYRRNVVRIIIEPLEVPIEGEVAL